MWPICTDMSKLSSVQNMIASKILFRTISGIWYPLKRAQHKESVLAISIYSPKVRYVASVQSGELPCLCPSFPGAGQIMQGCLKSLFKIRISQMLSKWEMHKSKDQKIVHVGRDPRRSSCSTSCSKQGHLLDQTSCSELGFESICILTTPKDGECTATPARSPEAVSSAGSQPLLTGQVLQPLTHHSSPPLNQCQFVNDFLVLGT